MSLITLHRKYSSVDYENRLCSIAAFLTLIIILLTITLPFVWIFKMNDNRFSSSSDFIKFEQPMVKFPYKYILIAEQPMETEAKLVICSSFDFLNQLGETKDCAKIRLKEKDKNFDGVPDEIQFSSEFLSMFKYGVKTISLVIFLDTRLERVCELRVPSAIIIKRTTSANKIVIEGSLTPSQEQVIVCPYFLRNVKTHFFYEKLNENSTRLEDFHLSRILENLERNPIHFKFSESAAYQHDLNHEKTSIQIKVKIPEQAIRYSKSFWQTLNDVWMNYLAVFVITAAAANFILNRLFESGWLVSRKKLSA